MCGSGRVPWRQRVRGLMGARLRPRSRWIEACPPRWRQGARLTHEVEDTWMVVIGADSHKRTHTVVALDEVGRRHGTKTVRTNSGGGEVALGPPP